jgi:M6 family metalloprotease-like protein
MKNKSGRLIASSKIAGKDAKSANMKKHLRPDGSARAQSMNMQASASADIGAGAAPVTGTSNIPVIIINFSNTTTTYSAADFNTLLFGTGNKSMKDYYEEISYGSFSVSAGPSGVAGWYTASNTHNYYGTNDGSGYDMWPGTLVREAVAAADSSFDFAPYDQDGDCYVDVLNLVHQGSGEEAGGPSTDIWSHRWDLNSADYFGYSSGGEYITNDVCPAGGNIIINDYVVQPEILGGGLQTIGVFAHEY